MTLSDWMRSHGITDEALSVAIGGISPHGVRKLRFRARGPSIRVSAAIDRISGGKVRPIDMVPLKRRAAPVPAGAAP